MPTKEVPLWTKASPVCLEREDHATTASDGVCDIQIRLFIVRSTKLTWAGKYFSLCDDLVISGADLDEIGRVKLQLAALFDRRNWGTFITFSRSK